MGKPTNYLPNTDIPPQNFPVSNINQLVDSKLQNKLIEGSVFTKNGIVEIN